MLNKKIEKEYTSGMRKNSFFADMPVKKRRKRKSASIAPDRIDGYVYHISSDGDLLREPME